MYLKPLVISIVHKLSSFSQFFTFFTAQTPLNCCKYLIGRPFDRKPEKLLHMLRIYEEEAMNAVNLQIYYKREREREREQTDRNIIQDSIIQHYFTEHIPDATMIFGSCRDGTMVTASEEGSNTQPTQTASEIEILL